ncbi:MAG: DDE-type integrase/transposase/recombinase [Kiritimatiellia bacterium]
MNPSSISLPSAWSDTVRTAVLHSCSLAHYAIVHARSWCADSRLQRVRLAGRLDRARNEITLLREEIRIKGARMRKIPARHRPFYPPAERMAILEMKAVRGWNLRQTAEAFLVEPEAVASWMKRVEDDSLVQINTPVNRFPAFVRYLTQRIKVLCPVMGKQRIAGVLARAGLHLSGTTVGRILRERSFPTGPVDPVDPVKNMPCRTVTARHPNHVWHVDLTTVPTGKGFWTSWFPHALPQVWPFCWWVAVVIDHFSRRVMGLAVFPYQPSSLEVRTFLGRVMGRNKAHPKHIISDRGGQFDCPAFRKWAKRKRIKPRYGAVGKYGSIAVVERFIRSLKNECIRQILVPLDAGEFREELELYSIWYNEFRPHTFLNGRTPEERYNQEPLKLPTPDVPNCQLPEMRLNVSFLEGRKHLPVVELKKAA